MHIGFSAVCAIFIGYYIPISFIGGYPFWGGFSFIISGSLSVAAEKHHKSCLVKGSLGMNITSAIFSAIGIILLLTELIINASFERHSWLGGAKGITAMLFLLTVLEFCIAVSTSHFASEALCYTPSDSMLYVPYVVNANVVVPAPQITSPQMAAPPPYSNVAYDPKEEMEHRAA
nr:membrane-spanning 4-domains subfamily A member 12-like [Pelodiscus sinensis]|eukprot:XP_006111810.1 membrane-spanning 4-domains subfamily A member 12-like [Pelodiscus sinensis]